MLKKPDQLNEVCERNIGSDTDPRNRATGDHLISVEIAPQAKEQTIIASPHGHWDWLCSPEFFFISFTSQRINNSKMLWRPFQKLSLLGWFGRLGFGQPKKRHFLNWPKNVLLQYLPLCKQHRRIWKNLQYLHHHILLIVNVMLSTFNLYVHNKLSGSFFQYYQSIRGKKMKLDKKTAHFFPICHYTSIPCSKFILSLEWTVYTYSIRDLSSIKINSSQGDIGISNGCLIETRIILKRGLKEVS